MSLPSELVERSEAVWGSTVVLGCRGSCLGGAAHVTPEFRHLTLFLHADIEMSRYRALAALCLLLPLFVSVATADSPFCELTDEAACKEIEDCCWCTPRPPPRHHRDHHRHSNHTELASVKAYSRHCSSCSADPGVCFGCGWISLLRKGMPQPCQHPCWLRFS